MQLNPELAALIQQAAQTGPNMTETVSGGGGGRLLPEGYSLARLVEYIELGSQPQEFGGKAKDPKPEFQLGFALLSPGFANDDGTPYIFRPYSMTLDQNSKANAVAVFKTMNWKGDKTHFAQFLGEAFLVCFEHRPVDKAQPNGKKRSVMDLKKTLPPIDTLTRQPYSVPEVNPAMIRLFLWDYPTLDAWQSLYVDGTWDDGKSKNRTQETILGAVDFAGSALEQLLLTSGVPYKVPAKAAPAPAAPSSAVPNGVASPAGVQAPVAPAPEAGAPFVQPAAGAAAAVPPAGIPAGIAPPAASQPQGTIPTTSPSNSPAIPEGFGLPVGLGVPSQG